jgi:hypothetical protein
MDRESTPPPCMSSPATYQITVKGKLDNHWVDWFNGTLSMLEHRSEGGLHSILTCQVRDQAELMGILNQLNGLNLPLLQVTFLKPKGE